MESIVSKHLSLHLLRILLEIIYDQAFTITLSTEPLQRAQLEKLQEALEYGIVVNCFIIF